MSLIDVQPIASKCSHFAMCKIDFLGTGICHSAVKKPFVAYFPQGRMEITNAINKNLLTVTKALVDIAETCDLCGICDKQCYFINELRPFQVAKELKAYVKSYIDQGNSVPEEETDEVLSEIRTVVGTPWATNDLAIRIAYSRDGGPFSERNIPRYVVMVKTKQELAAIVKIANKYNIPISPRSSGSSGVGLALGKGIIIDFYRMKKIEVDPSRMLVKAEPGVTGFELQKEVVKYGYKINVGETSAGVCSNIITTRINSLYTHEYGNGLDLVIDGEFIDAKGNSFTLSEDPYALKEFNPHGIEKPPLCTEMTLKIFPKFDDEAALLLPFHSFSECLTLMHELSVKRVGIGLGVLSAESAAIFIAPTKKTENELKVVLKEKLGIHYFILIIGETHAIDNVKRITQVSIDQEMFRNIIYSIPKLCGHEGIDMLADIPSNKQPYEVLFKRGMENLVEVALDPDIENYYKAVAPDMQEYYKTLYSDPNLTDVLWLNLFRLTTPRLSRETQYCAVLLHLAINEMVLIPELTEKLDKVGIKYGLKSFFSNLSPLFQSRWIMFEYDFFHDQTNEQEREKARKAINESYELLLDYIATEKIKNGFLSMITRWQGLARYESIIQSL
ncbi:MAG: FAD-dependent oxidoreductase [Bacteroidota bacterium]|nr:MAG: FAD-dependent oxidoreductase [Bacteroidota bacterium]